MKIIALTAAALLVAAGSAFAEKPTPDPYAHINAAKIDTSSTSSVQTNGASVTVKKAEPNTFRINNYTRSYGLSAPSPREK